MRRAVPADSHWRSAFWIAPWLLAMAGCGGSEPRAAHTGSQSEDPERLAALKQARAAGLLGLLTADAGGAALGEVGSDFARECRTTTANWSISQFVEERFLAPPLRDADDPRDALRTQFALRVGAPRVRELEACLPEFAKLGFLAVFAKDGQVSIHAGSSLEENKHHPPRRLTEAQRACANEALSGTWFRADYFEGQAIGLVRFEPVRDDCGRSSEGELPSRDHADRVEVSVSAVEGGLTASLVAPYLHRRANELGTCYFEHEDGSLRGRDEPTIVDVRFEVNEGGGTLMPKVVGVEEADAARCIAVTIARIDFPSSEPRSTVRLRIAFGGTPNE